MPEEAADHLKATLNVWFSSGDSASLQHALERVPLFVDL